MDNKIAIVEINNSHFANIVEWLKTKVLFNPNYVKEIIGDLNHRAFHSKFITRKPQLSNADFAEMFITELELIRFSSPDAVNQKYAEGVLILLKTKYETEKRSHQERLTEIKLVELRASEKVENYLQLLDCSIEEFKAMRTNVQQPRHYNQFDAHAIENYMNFKQIILDKFKLLELRLSRDDDYITVVQLERLKLTDRLANIILGLNSQQAAQQSQMPTSVNLKLSDLQREMGNICCICCVEYTATDDLMILKCSHMFHTPCIVKWLEKKNACPCCRM
jgi:hypothetical protein